MSLAGRYLHLERQPTTRQERAMQHPQSTRALASSHALSSLGLAHRLASVIIAQSWLASNPRIGSARRARKSPIKRGPRFSPVRFLPIVLTTTLTAALPSSSGSVAVMLVPVRLPPCLAPASSGRLQAASVGVCSGGPGS